MMGFTTCFNKSQKDALPIYMKPKNKSVKIILRGYLNRITVVNAVLRITDDANGLSYFISLSIIDDY